MMLHEHETEGALRWYLTGEPPTLGVEITPSSLHTLRLRKKGEPLLPWYERPSLCFITGRAGEHCECCGCWTAGRTPAWAESYPPCTPLCPGCDDMRRHAGLPITEGTALFNQRWMHDAYDALPRAVRDFPLEAAHV